jgi:DNA polymerase elongation subunit (family B)
MTPATQTGTIYKISYFVSQSGELLVRLMGRDVNGNKIDCKVSGCVPYFYAPADTAEMARTLIEVTDVEPGPPDMNHLPTIKVCVKYPWQVRDIRPRFGRTYEADLPFANRVRIDYNLNYVEVPISSTPIPIEQVKTFEEPPAVKPRILYYDIETDDTSGFGDPENPTKEITAISFCDDYRDKYAIIYQGDKANLADITAKLPIPFMYSVALYPVRNEYELLGMFGGLIRKINPDVVDAYNGYGYDHPYVAGRAALHDYEHNDDLKILFESFSEDENRSKGSFALVDSLAIFRKQEMRQKEYSLEAVSQELIGMGKVERGESVSALQRDDPVKWLAYSLFDTHLLRLISEKRDMVNYLTRIAFLAGIEPADCSYNSRIVDGTLFQEARNNPSRKPEICLPTKTGGPGEYETAEAAMVFQPEVALHEWVSVVDLAQTYPSIEQTLNISPETFSPKPVAGKTYDIPGYGSFFREPPGLIPRALKRMKAHRQKAKKKASEAAPGSPEKKEADTLSQSIKYIVNCGKKGTLVATAKGPKSIEQITSQDSVYCYTKDGIVLATTKGAVSSGRRPVYRMRTKLRTIHVTSNHPFLVSTCSGDRRYNHNHELKWRPLSELHPGDLVVITNWLPVTGKPVTLPDGSLTTIDFCKVLGCFAGDGFVTHVTDKHKLKWRKQRLREPTHVNLALPIGSVERHKYEVLAKKVFGQDATVHNKWQMRLGGKKVADLFVAMDMDHPAPEKQLPEWVFALPINQQKALIEGLVDSDGCEVHAVTARYENWSIVSTSKKLLDQTRFLCYNAGYRVGAVCGPNWAAKRYFERNPLYTEKGHKFEQKHASYSLQIFPHNAVPRQPGTLNQPCTAAIRRGQASLPPGFELQAIRSIEPDGEEETFDIEVEGHHNFIAEGVVAHNSYTGVLKEAHWRLKNTVVFESVTAVARMQLCWNKDHIEDPSWLSAVLSKILGAAKWLGKVIMGHTDSCYFKLWKDGVQVKDYDTIVAASNAIRDALNATYPEFMHQFGVDGQQYSSVDLEGIFDIFRTLPKAGSTEGAKTRYYGSFVYKDGKDLRGLPFEARKKIMGIEYKRFNNASIAKEAQFRVISLVCEGKSDDVKPYYESLRHDCLELGVRDDNMLIPAKMGASYAEGRRPPAWVTAMNHAQEILGFVVRPGDVWKWAYVTEVWYKGKYHDVFENPAKPEGGKVFAIPYRYSLEEMKQRGLKMVLDRKRMFEKTVERPMELVFPDLLAGMSLEDQW